MNDKKINIILAINVFLILLFAIFSIQSCNENKKQLSYIQNLEIKQKQIGDNILRSSSSSVSKEDLDKLIKESKVDLSKIEKDLKSLDGKVESLNKVQVVSYYQNQTNIPTQVSIPKPNDKVEVKPEELKKETQYITIGEQFINQTIPTSKVGFSYWRNNPWEYEVYKRDYKITNVIAKDKDNNTIVYNKFTINSNNKDYEILLDKSETIQSLPESKFHFYPKLFLAASTNYGTNGFNNSLNVYANFIQYGQFRNNPTYALLNFGIGTNFQDYKVVIVPVFFNLKTISKYFQNSYIGLGTGIYFNKNIDFGINFGLSF